MLVTLSYYWGCRSLTVYVKTSEQLCSNVSCTCVAVCTALGLCVEQMREENERLNVENENQAKRWLKLKQGGVWILAGAHDGEGAAEQPMNL